MFLVPKEVSMDQAFSLLRWRVATSLVHLEHAPSLMCLSLPPHGFWIGLTVLKFNGFVVRSDGSYHVALALGAAWLGDSYTVAGVWHMGGFWRSSFVLCFI